MTRVIIIGEIYNADLSVGGGPMPGGPGWGAPVDPGYGRPGWSPVDPGYGRPDWGPGHPANRPPGSYPGGHPGNRPPGSSPGYPTTGPVPPGGPVDPGYGHPGWGPVDPGFGWGGGAHPGNRPPGSGEYPSGQPLPPGAEGPGTPVPEDVYTPAPVPEEIASQIVVSVYDPKTMVWTTTTYPPV